MRPQPLALLAAAATALLLSACGSSSGGSGGGTTATTTTPPVKRVVSVVYATPENKDLALGKTILTAGGTTAVAKALAGNFNLPWNFKVLVRNTSDTGPYFDPDTRTINLDYGFAAFIIEQIKRIHPDISDYDLGKSAAAVDSFIYVHEFAHLLINAFDLPITGKEEDAADQLATLFLVKYVKNGDEYAFDAAEFFDSLAKNPSELKQSDFFDEHSLDQQRAYDIVCWIAGSSQSSYDAIGKAAIFSKGRLQRCPDEYQQIDHAWTTLLQPHYSTAEPAEKNTTTAPKSS